jgi:hypothetical protein
MLSMALGDNYLHDTPISAVAGRVRMLVCVDLAISIGVGVPSSGLQREWCRRLGDRP